MCARLPAPWTGVPQSQPLTHTHKTFKSRVLNNPENRPALRENFSESQQCVLQFSKHSLQKNESAANERTGVPHFNPLTHSPKSVPQSDAWSEPRNLIFFYSCCQSQGTLFLLNLGHIHFGKSKSSRLICKHTTVVDSLSCS